MLTSRFPKVASDSVLFAGGPQPPAVGDCGNSDEAGARDPVLAFVSNFATLQL
jgi:hypothetical protein